MILSHHLPSHAFGQLQMLAHRLSIGSVLIKAHGLEVSLLCARSQWESWGKEENLLASWFIFVLQPKGTGGLPAEKMCIHCSAIQLDAAFFSTLRKKTLLLAFVMYIHTPQFLGCAKSLDSLES